MMVDEPLVQRKLENGRTIWLWRYLFNWRLQLSSIFSDQLMDNEWCFSDEKTALESAQSWDGEGDPPGWFKNMGTGAYNPDSPQVQERAAAEETWTPSEIVLSKQVHKPGDTGYQVVSENTYEHSYLVQLGESIAVQLERILILGEAAMKPPYNKPAEDE